MARKIDSIIVLALATLAGAGNWDRVLSNNVYELNGYTVLVQHGKLVVHAPTGARKEVGL
jgi:hypothetical protein